MMILYAVWGSTYVAIRFALESFPALTMSGIRFLLAGALLYWLRGGPGPLAREWRSAALVGLLLIGLGTGCVAFAEQSLSSGQCALMVALVPVWMTVWECFQPGGRYPGWLVTVGLLLGTCGVGSLVWDSGSAPGALQGSLVMLGGTLAWAAGSLASRKLPQPADPLRFSAMTMLWGGLWLTLLGLLRGEAWDGHFTASAVMAWVYLVVFGSMVGVSTYTWLLRQLPPQVVGTYTYVNPLVAMGLAHCSGESLPQRWPLAMVLTLGGVALVSLGGLPQIPTTLARFWRARMPLGDLGN